MSQRMPQERFLFSVVMSVLLIDDHSQSVARSLNIIKKKKDKHEINQKLKLILELAVRPMKIKQRKSMLNNQEDMLNQNQNTTEKNIMNKKSMKKKKNIMNKKSITKNLKKKNIMNQKSIMKKRIMMMMNIMIKNENFFLPIKILEIFSKIYQIYLI